MQYIPVITALLSTTFALLLLISYNSPTDSAHNHDTLCPIHNTYDCNWEEYKLPLQNIHANIHNQLLQ